MPPTNQTPEGAPRRARRRQDRLLARLERAARLCAEVERALREHPAPELETLIKLHRVLILKSSLEAETAPQMLKLVSDLMKPALEWARLQEKLKEREQAEKAGASGDGSGKHKGLRPETLEKIERELRLL